MDITPAQREQIRKRQAANILEKLARGKTITAREQRLLDEFGGGEPNFAGNWDELAQAIGVTRRTTQEWRKDKRYAKHCPKPSADGRHDINAWKVFMQRFGLKRADEVVDPDEIPEERRTIRDWKEYREKLMCTQLERSILRDDRILLVATEIEIAIGQLIAGVSVALDHFAPSAARFIVGLRDIHDVQAKLQSEIDAVKQRINASRYLDECDEAAKPYLQRIGRLLLADIMTRAAPSTKANTHRDEVSENEGSTPSRSVTPTRKRGAKAAGKA